MSDIAVPRTPSPLQPVRQERSSRKSASVEIEDSHTIDSQYRSTPLPVQIDLTPPPSTQIQKPARTARMTQNRESSLASPPPTGKIAPPISQGRLFGELPTPEAVENMSEDQLRTLIGELLPALSEARTLAAHSKLQHQLLGIEASEAARRAEVEREMTLKEVQVLQESPRGNGSLLSPPSPQASAQRHLDLALKKCRQLQHDIEKLERRMHAARKLIRDQSGQIEDLREDNQRLRQRIKQNRDHLNAMRSSGAISVIGTPHTDFGTPVHHRTPKTPATARSAHPIVTPSRSQDAFDALLVAGQYLNNEANSVPSTPTPLKDRKVNQAHHIRGAHSLSSLPSTPNRSRPVTADNAYLTPTPQRTSNSRASMSVPAKRLIYNDKEPPSTQARSREDRDSTISASEDEEQYVGASQASQRATEMLRRSAMNSKDNTPNSSQKHQRSESASQSKIYGQIKKPRSDGAERADKRVGSSSVYEDIGRGPKKVKTANGVKESVGLGIKQWEGASQ
ncbi:MAG: hypothetical protein Q9218_007212 [Villophora microphyllina]